METNEETFAVAKVAEENIPRFRLCQGCLGGTASIRRPPYCPTAITPRRWATEIIASRFFRALLEHDGLPVPPWDQEEVDTVRKAFETKGAQGNVEPWKP